MGGPSSNSNNQSASLRSLKILVILLIVSNLGLGVFGVYVLRTVDRRYSELVDNSLPVLNDLRQLMSTAVGTQRATDSRLFVAPEASGADALPNARAAVAREEKFANNALAASGLVPPTLRTNLQKAGDAHRAAADELIRLIEAGRTAEGDRLREDTLRPSFDHYVSLIDRVSDAVLAQSERANNSYTDKTSTVSAIMMSVAAWPLLVLAALLLLTAVFVIAMMVAFRGKDLADMP